jgi:hypothetical protein
MPRGARRYTNQRPYCPGCGSQAIDITGPVEEIKGIDKAPCQCRTCGRTWKSENRGILMLAMAGK